MPGVLMSWAVVSYVGGLAAYTYVIIVDHRIDALVSMVS